jgi:hypothetical protein
MKVCGGTGVNIHVFLTLAVVEGELSASFPDRFTPGEGTSDRRLGRPQGQCRHHGEEKILDPTGT